MDYGLFFISQVEIGGHIHCEQSKKTLFGKPERKKVAGAHFKTVNALIPSKSTIVLKMSFGHQSNPYSGQMGMNAVNVMFLKALVNFEAFQPPFISIQPESGLPVFDARTAHNCPFGWNEGG